MERVGNVVASSRLDPVSNGAEIEDALDVGKERGVADEDGVVPEGSLKSEVRELLDVPNV